MTDGQTPPWRRAARGQSHACSQTNGYIIHSNSKKDVDKGILRSFEAANLDRFVDIFSGSKTAFEQNGV